MEATTSIESEESISLQIYDHNNNNNNNGGGRMSTGGAESGGPSPTTIFEPRSYVETKNNSTCNSVHLGNRQSLRAPEKKLTLFALRYEPKPSSIFVKVLNFCFFSDFYIFFI